MTPTLSPCVKTKAKAKSTTTLKPKAPKGKGASPAADKKKRKSRRKYRFKYEQLSLYFHMPQKLAAKELGVAGITVKRNCKEIGLKWPYRMLKQQAGNRPVMSVRELAFKQLPIVCMLEAGEEEEDDDDEMSECDTDTESIEDDEQERRDFSAILLSMHKTPLV